MVSLSILQMVNSKDRSEGAIGIANKFTVPLEIGVYGTKPFFFYDGSIRGSDILILQLMSKKLGFNYNLKIVDYENLVKLVRVGINAKCYGLNIDLFQTGNGTLDAGFAQLSQLHSR